MLELYLGGQDEQLRYFDAEGQLVATLEEDAAQARRRAERLAEQLRSLGMEPED